MKKSASLLSIFVWALLTQVALGQAPTEEDESISADRSKASAITDCAAFVKWDPRKEDHESYFTKKYLGNGCDDLSGFSSTDEERTQNRYTGPIIDMHLHAGSIDDWGVESPIAVCAPFEQYPVWDNREESYEEFFTDKYLKNPSCVAPLWSLETEEEVMEQTVFYMEKHNVYGVLSGKPNFVNQWIKNYPARFIPGLHFELGTDDISPDSLRSLVKTGNVEVFGEIANAYYGITPDDPRMKPYWKLAEELNTPVGIHVGGSPPGEPYLGNGARSRLESPMTLEEVLLEHPRLRLYIMHAGYPMLDDLLNILHIHPQVYVGVGAIVFSKPRPAFYRFLRNIIEGGFGNRVMFGSDQMVWPEAIERSINTIQEAPFLTQQQKADVFYNNAARFLGLSEEEIAEHHDNIKPTDQ